MEIRQMATAFLVHEDHILMMKKSNSRLHSATFWAAPGGHLEIEELNEPRSACLRELREETGLLESDIEGLQLRYILFRRKGDEIRQQFVYWGRAATRQVIPSEEGELQWVRREDVRDLALSEVVRQMLIHYFDHPNLQHVTIGTITMQEVAVRMQWSSLVDPMIF